MKRVFKITPEEDELIGDLLSNYGGKLEVPMLDFLMKVRDMKQGIIEEHGVYIGSAVCQELASMFCVMIQTSIMGEHNAKDGLIHALYHCSNIDMKKEHEADDDEGDKDNTD